MNHNVPPDDQSQKLAAESSGSTKMPASAADQWIELVTEGTTVASQGTSPADLDREVLREVAEWEQAAALAQMALQQAQTSELPASLRGKLAQQAMSQFGFDAPQGSADSLSPASEVARVRKQSQSVGLLGWVVASCLAIVLAVMMITNRNAIREAPPRRLSPAESRALLLASADTIRLPARSPNLAENKSLGDLVWSNEAQTGFMRLTGVPVNDPKQAQYQLWIFDKDRDDKFPVDGGVFDVVNENEVIVPINPKLKINGPVLFAVTREKPGGVVVSDRSQIVWIAK